VPPKNLIFKGAATFFYLIVKHFFEIIIKFSRFNFLNLMTLRSKFAVAVHKAL
jgi:hypothetical protein